jgi:hypothetical protein
MVNLAKLLGIARNASPAPRRKAGLDGPGESYSAGIIRVARG